MTAAIKDALFPSWEADVYNQVSASLSSPAEMFLSEHHSDSLPMTSVPRHPPITQKTVVLCSMLMFRMGKEARKQSSMDHYGMLHSPYEPVPIPKLLQMTLIFVLFMAIIIFFQEMKHNAKLRERISWKWQSTFKARSTDAFVFLSALFG